MLLELIQSQKFTQSSSRIDNIFSYNVYLYNENHVYYDIFAVSNYLSISAKIIIPLSFDNFQCSKGLKRKKRTGKRLQKPFDAISHEIHYDDCGKCFSANNRGMEASIYKVIKTSQKCFWLHKKKKG